ncbi:MAG: hypothetical protein ACOY3E_12520 [Pseudomonadota bacterium]
MEITPRGDTEIVHIPQLSFQGMLQLLSPEVPWIWLLGHRPNRYVQWWSAELPFRTDGINRRAYFRDVAYDAMLKTGDFLTIAEEISDDGLVLIQSMKMMPDMLLLDRISESQQDSVLAQNGAFLRVHLSQHFETAMVQCFRKGYLAAKLNDIAQAT